MENCVFYSITKDESEQLEKEYEINDIIYYLERAKMLVGNITIDEALNGLYKKTRFAKEIKNKFYKKYYPLTYECLLS